MVPRWETVEVPCTVQVPVYNDVQVAYTVQVPYQETIEQSYTVNVPYQETMTATRMVCQRVPVTQYRTVSRDLGSYQCQTVQVPVSSGSYYSGGKAR